MPSATTWNSAPSNPNNSNHNFLNLTGSDNSNERAKFRRRQSQQSNLAKFAMQSSTQIQQEEQRRKASDDSLTDEKSVDQLRHQLDDTLSPTPSHSNGVTSSRRENGVDAKSAPVSHLPPRSMAMVYGSPPQGTGPTRALNDTPAPSAPTSPSLNGNRPPTSDATPPVSIGVPMRPPNTGSGSSTPRIRPTTLDIPGLTKSKASPDGRIAKRDVGAKLVIVMVGLPARGKSYITKKLARYLNWLQHDTKIFNVGERRRVVAGGPFSQDRMRTWGPQSPPAVVEHLNLDLPEAAKPRSVAQILLNGETEIEAPSTPKGNSVSALSRSKEPGHRDVHGDEERDLYQPDMGEPSSPVLSRKKTPVGAEGMEQNAAFFDPENQEASQIREQLARETLDELLDFVLDQNGTVGILDATNSTMQRRKMVMDRIRERAGPDLNVLFLESSCVDKELLEANMRLKLSGPDYRTMDPNVALADFKKRVQAYEKAYVPLGEYEERHNMPYIQMVDVGRKIVSHQIKGFLMAQANYYLLNFNLSPRQIWITRHGLSMDNVSGKIGGDSELAPEGHQYAKALVRFMDERRKEWDMKQLRAVANSHFPPQPGDVTPPNPYYQVQFPGSQTTSECASTTSSDNGTDPGSADIPVPAFCVWTSMLKRSIETAQYFNDDEYDVKQMRMLDELNAGTMEGLTYNAISSLYPEEYARRRSDKLHYRYPGPGGEGYLDIINRLRPVIVELERMTDNVLLIGHRSVARVLLAYFKGLGREQVADLDVPIGMLYCLEPRPYGVDFKAFRWDKGTEWFYEMPDFQLKAAREDAQ